MLLLCVLPLISVVAIAALLWHRKEADDEPLDLRLAWAASVLLTTGVSVAVFEIAGQLHAIAPWPVRGAWLAVTIALLLLALRHRVLVSFVGATYRAASAERFGACVLITIVGLAALAGLATPPDNSDSLTYHLPRCLFWLQQRSLDHFATGNLRQLEFGPLHSMLFLHLEALTDSDRLFNVVQTTAFVLVLLPCASWMMQALGATRRVRCIALIAIAGTPMVALQCASTQSDVLLAAWLAATVAFAWRFTQRADAPTGIYLGLAAGAAILTKGTALIYGLPIAAWCGWHAWQRQPFGRLAGAGALAGAMIFGLNLGHYSRNWHLSGTVFGQYSQLNQPAEFSLRGTASITLKNAALQAEMRYPHLNRLVERVVRGLHARVLQLDTDDPRFRFLQENFRVSDQWRSEDYAGNPLQVLLLAGTAGFAGTRRLLRRRETPSLIDRPTGLGVVVVAAALLFCALLNWQPWGSRLVVPLFCLGFIWAAPHWNALGGKWVSLAAMAALGLAAAPWVLRNQTRPLIGSDSVFHLSREELWNLGDPLAREVLTVLPRFEVGDLGLNTGEDSSEYRILRWLRSLPGTHAAYHVAVRNYSAQCREGKPLPDLVVSDLFQTATCTIEGRRYRRVWLGEVFSIYRAAE